MYSLYKSYKLSNEDNNKKEFLGRNNNKICRFCGKDASEVSFHSNAHAVSEGLGNKHLFTNYECDKCNDKFSEYENHLISMLSLHKAARGIQGKKGKHKLTKGLDCQYFSDDQLFNMTIDKNGFNNKNITIKINPDDKTLSIENKAKFNRFLIYKSFIKFAISVFPEEWLEDYLFYIDLLNNKVESDSLGNEATFYTSIFEDIKSNTNINIYLKNKEESKIPSVLVGIEFSNFVFYVFLKKTDESLLDLEKIHSTLTNLSDKNRKLYTNTSCDCSMDQIITECQKEVISYSDLGYTQETIVD